MGETEQCKELSGLVDQYESIAKELKKRGTLAKAEYEDYLNQVKNTTYASLIEVKGDLNAILQERKISDVRKKLDDGLTRLLQLANQFVTDLEKAKQEFEATFNDIREEANTQLSRLQCEARETYGTAKRYKAYVEAKIACFNRRTSDSVASLMSDLKAKQESANDRYIEARDYFENALEATRNEMAEFSKTFNEKRDEVAATTKQETLRFLEETQRALNHALDYAKDKLK